MSDMPTDEEIGNGIPYNSTYAHEQEHRDLNRERIRMHEKAHQTEAIIDKPDTIEILKFPHDLPKYHMSFNFDEYKRPSQFEGLTSEGTRTYISLPIPTNMIDRNSFSYNRGEPGIIVEGIANIIAKNGGGYDGLVNTFKGGNLGETMDQTFATLSGKGIKTVVEGGKKVVGDDIVDGSIQIAGLADNPFATVAFSGPNFKAHSFSWRLSPKYKEESETIRKIVAAFKKAAHPELMRLELGGFYKYPSIVFPKFNPDEAEKYLYKFKACVITNLDINYVPPGNNRPNFFHTNAPVEVEISISLMEIELWRNGDGENMTVNSNDFNAIESPIINLGSIE